MIKGMRAESHEGVSSELLELIPGESNFFHFIEEIHVIGEKNRFRQLISFLNVRKLEQFSCGCIGACFALFRLTIEIIKLSVVFIGQSFAIEDQIFEEIPPNHSRSF